MLLLRLLFVLNAAAAFATGVALFVVPGFIPSTVGIELPASAHFVAYLLGAAEIGIAVLCAFGAAAPASAIARPVTVTLVVFHLASALADGLAAAEGVGAAVWWNVAARVLIVALLLAFGLRPPRPSD